MRRGAIGKKLIVLFLSSICFFNVACGQTEKERIEKSYQFEDKALELRTAGDLQGAIREQKKAIAINATDAKPLTVLASMYIEAEDWQNALETAQKAIKFNPNEVFGHSLSAVALEKLNRKKEALPYRENAVKLEPEDLDLLVNLGNAQEMLGDNSSARKSYEKALEKDSNYTYALYRLGLLEIEENKIEGGKELLRKIVILNSTLDKDKSFVEEARNKLKELEAEKSKN